MKQLIPYAELLKKIQGLLGHHTECRNIHIGGIEVYRERIDAANWNVTTYRRSGNDNDWYACSQMIDAEIRNLRECYDVAVSQ